MRFIAILAGMALSFVASAALVNTSFETPVVSTDTANPANAEWVFSGDAGLSCSNSSFMSLNLYAIPDGRQVAYLGTVGSISQTFTNDKAGIYEFRLQASQRNFPFNDLEQSFTVSFDGNVLETCQPASDASYYTYTTNITLSKGVHTIAFQGQNPAFLDMVFIDAIQLQLVPTLQLVQNGKAFNLTVLQGLTNRVYTISRRTTVGGGDTIITNTATAQTVTLTNQPSNQAFYYISALSEP